MSQIEREEPARVVPYHLRPAKRSGTSRFANDYCVKLASPLSIDPSVVMNDYNQWAVYGGGDPPESSFHALVAAAQSETPGWGTVPTAARLIVMVTDAAPHFEGDGFNSFGLPNFSGVFDEANNDQQCITQYYPNPGTVKQAIAGREAYLATLVYGGSHDSGLPIESWKWVNTYLGQTAGFVYDLEHDSSDFWLRLSEIITLLEDIECGTTSTTSTTTTTTTTTPALTTTTPTPAPATTLALTTTTPTPAPATTLALTTTTTVPDAIVTPVGTVETTTPPTDAPPTDAATECPPCETECPPCPPATECNPCCCEGALIKLHFKPKKIQLLVEN